MSDTLEQTYCVMPAQTGAAFLLRKGELLRVMTPHDYQVSDLFCFNARNLWESLSAGRSIDWADTIYLTSGHHLYSNRSNVMLTILEDSCGRHDFLMTPCSLRMFQMIAGNEDYHPSCHENLARNLAEFGIHEDQISTTFNIFMNVTVDEKGGVKIETPFAKTGDFVLFRAEMDLVVGLTACSHEGTNHGTCKPIWYRKESGGTKSEI
ncbi:DUF1989 domain-containing protein [Bdellovibrio bacteriovorus]|nr:urea carboxylase-associated family protein [Bdellovibrio bacteriovorus]